jgi:hypothetical protein
VFTIISTSNPHTSLFTVETVFVRPLEVSIKDDFKSVKDESKRYERARSNYESSLDRLTSLHKKENTKTAETEHEVRVSRQQYEQSSLDYVCMLNAVQSKQKIDFGDGLCSILISFMSYFQQASVLFQVSVCVNEKTHFKNKNLISICILMN